MIGGMDLFGWITDRFTPPPQIVTRLDGARLVARPTCRLLGNYVVLDAEPSPAELERWIARWGEIIGEPLPRGGSSPGSGRSSTSRPS